MFLNCMYRLLKPPVVLGVFLPADKHNIRYSVDLIIGCIIFPFHL